MKSGSVTLIVTTLSAAASRLVTSVAAFIIACTDIG
jgi:hypothetical protein